MLSSTHAWDMFNGIQTVLLWIAIVLAIWVLIPQLIQLTKNKYADNSSPYLYLCYLVCNVAWFIYMCLYLPLKYHDGGSTYIYVLLWTQWLGQLILVCIGATSLGLKLHYNHNRKINKKDAYAESVLKLRVLYQQFYTDEKSFLVNELNSLTESYQPLVYEIFEVKNASQLNEKFAKANTVQLCVKITQIYYSLYQNTEVNQYLVGEAQYMDALNKIKSYIDMIAIKYPSILMQSTHHRMINNKVWKQTIIKNYPKKSASRQSLKMVAYQQYMQQISLVSAWGYLCEIYQNFLSL